MVTVQDYYSSKLVQLIIVIFQHCENSTMQYNSLALIQFKSAMVQLESVKQCECVNV